MLPPLLLVHSISFVLSFASLVQKSIKDMEKEMDAELKKKRAVSHPKKLGDKRPKVPVEELSKF